jgi:tRNA A-37 threonylcarbamoyl transferase component Bud32
VVEHYNSSTLPPGVDPSMLDGAELVAVEVTETTLGDGTTSYSYVIITRSDGAERTIVVNPTTASDGGDSNTAAQSGSSVSDSSNAAKSSSSLGAGAIIGIIAAAVVFMLVVFAFFVAQRRRNKHRPSDASSEDLLASPVVGKQERLGQGQSPADTEYQEITRTTGNSRSSGASMPDGRQRRSTMWEDPVILASRIPIDRIELGAVISRGGFGEVYRGRYRDQDVAVKTLLPEKRKDMAHIQAFLAEVRLAATMDHPNVVRFIGVAWESLSDLYCVTEFMAGGDLRSLLRDYLANDVPQGMDASKMQIAYEVAHALTYLHSLEPVVLHRDLKSRNILLTEALHAKVTDFGASRVRSDATMTAGVGSSLWMAPEVMMGQRYDERADVFSLGVVISELDTHELPYSHAKESGSAGGRAPSSSSTSGGGAGRSLPDTAVLQMVSMGKLRVQFSPFMDPGMARFVGSCVSVDPRDRPTAAEVLYYLQVAMRNRQF